MTHGHRPQQPGTITASNRLEEAEPLMRKSLEIFFKFTEVTGYQHPNLQGAIENYYQLLLQLGKTETEVLQNIKALAKTYGVNLGSSG